MLSFASAYFGFKLVENPMLTVPGPEDWSRVRSPGRARRRRRRHRQNIVIPLLPDPRFYRVGNAIYAHPVTMQALRRKAARDGNPL